VRGGGWEERGGGGGWGGGELVAFVLGTGARGKPAEVLADELLRAAGGLAALSRASPHELVGVAGIGEARALRIAAAFHLGRRVLEVARQRPSAANPREVWERLRGRVAGLAQELFLVIGLDARSNVLEVVEVARGSVDAVDVHPREVFRPLIRMAAGAGVLAHNHPSGDPRPSADDLEMTRRLRSVGFVVGIEIVDHVILGAATWTSLAEYLGDEW
jgi:DNA repair protein RadC